MTLSAFKRKNYVVKLSNGEILEIRHIGEAAVSCKMHKGFFYVTLIWPYVTQTQ